MVEAPINYAPLVFNAAGSIKLKVLFLSLSEIPAFSVLHHLRQEYLAGLLVPAKVG
jgi:hypothetical protein